MTLREIELKLKSLRYKMYYSESTPVDDEIREIADILDGLLEYLQKQQPQQQSEE